MIKDKIVQEIERLGFESKNGSEETFNLKINNKTLSLHLEQNNIFIRIDEDNSPQFIQLFGYNKNYTEQIIKNIEYLSNTL